MDTSHQPSISNGRPHVDHSDELFRLLVESLTDYAVFEIAPSGTITSWTAGVELVLGYGAEEFVGLPFAAIFTPEDISRKTPAAELVRARLTGRSDDKRIHVRKDGRRFPADDVVTAIRDDAGGVRAFLKVVRDTSDQRRASELYAEAQEANRLKDEFLGTVSHELRTPLNALLGWTHLLAVGPDRSGSAPSGRRRFGRNAEIQVQLVDDLLDVSRIISGKMRLHIARHQLDGGPECRRRVGAPGGARQGWLQLQHHPRPPRMSVPADSRSPPANRLEPARQRHQVHVVRRHASNSGALHRDGTIEITVRDTGRGNPRGRAAVCLRTVSPGGQFDHPPSRRHGPRARHRQAPDRAARRQRRGGERRHGSGRHVHGAPAVDVGAAAVRAGRAGPGVQPRDNLPPLTNIHVLVVDDDPDSREVLSIVLRESGAMVDAAASAAQALALIDRRAPDVIIADIGMPHEDGYRFHPERVRQLPAERGGQAAAIALTAYARAEDRRRALQAGYQMHVAKPIDPRAVVTAVAQLISASS